MPLHEEDMHSQPTTAELCRHIYDDLKTNLPVEIKDEIRNKGIQGILENLDDILPEYFINAYRYNYLKRQPESNRESGDRYETLSRSDFENFYLVLDATLSTNGLKTVGIDKARIIYNTVVFANKVDPFYEYIKTLVWDGKPRLRRWFIDGLGAHIPSLSQEDSDYLVEEVTQAWFMGAVKRCQHIQKFETVPILVSTKQGIGKTTYVQYTALYGVEQSWYRSTTKDISDQKVFFESISGAKIVEWAEAEQFKKKTDAESIKAFISQEEDTYRESYAKFPESNIRRWIPIVTTNESTLFSDTTGNRRFIPFLCDPNRIVRQVKWDSLNTPELLNDVQQVWAEALVMDKDGKLACLSPEAERLARIPQKAYTSYNEFYEALYEILDEEYPDIGTFLSNDDLRRIQKTLYELYPEMKQKFTPATSVVAHRPDEWIVAVARVDYTDANGVSKNKPKRGIKRIAEAADVEYNRSSDIRTWR